MTVKGNSRFLSFPTLLRDLSESLLYLSCL